jgi:LPPG:FO 2-phospho-L-lactate transferase
VRVALLAGGTGGTKLAHGFAQVLPGDDLAVIVNVGDDLELHGLHVSPDVDALLYTLGGLIDTERGWGLRGDTFTAHAMLERYGAPSWFRLGDADLATHIHRTHLMRAGATLTEATAAMASTLGIGARVLPATDDPVRTRVETDAGVLDFQDYFVRLRHEPEVRGVQLAGLETARASASAVEAIAAADLVVIGPSNPVVSIGPILALPELRAAVEASSAVRVAVSPIVAGAALKGPADRMLRSLGHEATALGVAKMYAGLVHRFVLDDADADLARDVAALGMEADVLPTVMRTEADRAALARAVMEVSRPA